MKARLPRLAALALAPALLLGALAPRSAHAADYKSIGDAPAILYDAPTLRGRKLSVAPRGMPVEVVVNEGDWDRVRDPSGDFSWVERKALSDRRTVVATTAATIFTSADAASPALARLEPGVWVELLEPPANGFAHVRHKDGTAGWVPVNQLWGL